MDGIDYNNIFMPIFKSKTINLIFVYQFNMDKNLSVGCLI